MLRDLGLDLDARPRKALVERVEASVCHRCLSLLLNRTELLRCRVRGVDLQQVWELWYDEQVPEHYIERTDTGIAISVVLPPTNFKVIGIGKPPSGQ